MYRHLSSVYCRMSFPSRGRASAVRSRPASSSYHSLPVLCRHEWGGNGKREKANPFWADLIACGVAQVHGARGPYRDVKLAAREGHAGARCEIMLANESA
jgi:hypothetical protein